jgi:ABC-type multidrug transport system permease subunit
MNNQNLKQARPFSVYVLMVLLLLLGSSAIYGGYNLIADPSGNQLQLPSGWLELTPFPSYLIPGLILFTVLGVFPLVVAILLYFKPDWSAMQPLEHLTHEHWSWLASVTVGIALLIWITVQFLMFGARHPVQIGLELSLGTLGIIIIAVSLFPSVRHYYQISKAD